MQATATAKKPSAGTKLNAGSTRRTAQAGRHSSAPAAVSGERHQNEGHGRQLVAGMVSDVRSTGEGKVTAPITSFPNFEHLEAKGLDRLAELRRRLQDGK